MRRISQPCGMEMKQDVLAAKGDLLNAQQTLSRHEATQALRDEAYIGDAQVAPKKQKQKEEGEEWTLPCFVGAWESAQSH